MVYASAVELYDQLANAPDERTRARILARAFEALEARYPHIQDLATRTHLSETELKLTKEIERVRADLTKEIAQVRAELPRDIERPRASILQWSFMFWAIQLAVLLTLLWRLWPAG